MIYLVCFLLSILLLGIPIKGKYARALAIFIGLLIPCTLAGMRAMAVGSDTAGYPLSMYEIALSNGFITYMKSTFMHTWTLEYVYDMGVGYATFVYVVSKLFHSYKALLFFTEMAIVVPVYRALHISFDRRKRCLGMAMFYLLFYNVTLNAMRQWIAMAILLLGFAYLRRDNKKWVICAIVAISSHKTGICGLLIYLIYYLIEKSTTAKKNNMGRKMIAFSISIASIVAIMNMGLVRVLISKIGLGAFLNYFAGSISFSISRFVLELPFIILIVMNKKYIGKGSTSYFLITYAIVNLLVSQINTMNILAWRISAYVSEFTVLLYPMLIGACKNRKKRNLEATGMLAYGLIYWIYYFYIRNVHETIPYIFS